ncbi:MAG: DUF423 domain-containing protein [Phycisphaerales bacterium]|nr:DUF423 domain-containing protein [Phycisphaerales bacterium]
MLSIIGAVVAGLSVFAGAFGAHALADSLTPQQAGWWDTANRYQFGHGLALVLCAIPPAGRARTVAGCAFLIGIAAFCGALYGLALGGPRWLGMVAPIGGASMMAGWAALAIALGRSRGRGRS